GGRVGPRECGDAAAAPRVRAAPTAGASLARRLTGARWRTGPRARVALPRRARRLAAAREPAGAADGSGPEPEIVPDRLVATALAEALDDPGPPTDYSPAGYARLRAFAAELAALRRRLDQPLPDLVGDVERTTGLDVEVAVRQAGATVAGTGPAGGGLARAHLDALGEVAARFAAEAPGATLPAFLAFLAAAEDEERGLTPGEVEVVEG